MSIQQPQSTDYLNSPDHSLSHRVFANDSAAPNEAVTVDASGNVTMSGNLSMANLSTDGTLSADSDSNIPSQKAVKTYVDGNSGSLLFFQVFN